MQKSFSSTSRLSENVKEILLPFKSNSQAIFDDMETYRVKQGNYKKKVKMETKREWNEVAFQVGTYNFQTINIQHILLEILTNLFKKKKKPIFQAKYMNIKRA